MKRILQNLILLCLLVLLHACGGSSASGDQQLDDLLKMLDTSLSGSRNLDNYVVNTFASKGIDITVDPEKLDFIATYGELAIGDEKTLDFTLSNNSGETRSFAFNTYAMAQGFALLDEYGNNLGAWNNIEIEEGTSKTYSIQFTARSYGTNLSYLVITADVDGTIQLPFRAKVSGGGSAFHAISGAYSCSDEDAPDISLIDFYKVPTGNEYAYGVKLCNIGGDNIQVYSAKITDGDASESSEYFTNTSFAGLDIFTHAEIDSEFGLDFDPTFASSFATPTLVELSTTIDSPSSYFSVVEDISQTLSEDITIEAGDYTKFDVTFAPNLKVEAPEGQQYKALPVNAILTFETSLGPIEINLYGATSGYEAQLALQYRFEGEETWQDLDMNSNAAAIDFGKVEVFLDSIPNNGEIVELQVANTGTSSYPLGFYPTSLVGYFEYYVEDGETLSFPLEVASGNADTFKIRYLPTPKSKDEETHWDIGQLKFSHTGASGPDGQVSFIADQSYGYAVTVKLNGSSLKHTYEGTDAKNICSVQMDGYGNAATEKTFIISNSDPVNTLKIDWSFADPEGEFTATSDSPSSFSIEPASTYSLTLELLANSSVSEGSTLTGSLQIISTLLTPDGQDLDDAYADYMADKESNDYTIALKGSASSSGTCDLTPDLFADADGDGIVNWYMIRNRTGMAMAPDLPESNRDLPPNYSLLPFEVDTNKMTIRFSKDILVPEDFSTAEQNKMFRAYSHFFTNSKGCPPLPTIPNAVDRGSWTEPNGLACGQVESSDGKFSVYMDQLNLPDKGPEDYTDADGVHWRTFKHRFGKVDIPTCKPEYHGEFTTIAYKPDLQTLEEFYEEGYADAYEDEAYYENYFGAWKHNSYITFDTDGFQCGSKTYNTGDTITDPDEIKECYLYLATLDESTRLNGRFDQESFFSFEIFEGDKDCDPWNDPDNCHGAGIVEPHLDKDGNPIEGYYDITLYNTEVNAYVLSAGDRTSFMRHASHTLYSKFYLTFTTKPLASEDDIDGDYKQLIATETRSDIDKNQIFLKDGEKYDIKLYFTEDGINSNMTNTLDPDSLAETGVDYGGYGKGAFRKCENSANCEIIPAGWPLNTLENNLDTLNGVAAFTLEGNIIPSFASASGGKGKPIYFSMQGCMIPEADMVEGRGCYDYKLDDAKMPDGETLVIDEYVERGMLPEGYPEDPAECKTFIEKGYNDPYNDDGTPNADYNPLKYLACINYTIEKIDRDHYTNYYDKLNPFVYENNLYGGSSCGYGM